MLVIDEALQKLIIETHSTVATLVERSIAVDNKLAVLLVRVDKTNGSVAAIQAEQYKQDGALVLFKWLFAATISIMAVGASVAGVVLAIVSRGG